MMTVQVCVQAVIAIALALVLYVGSRSLVDVLDAGLVTRRVDALRVYVRPHTDTHTDGQHRNIASTHCGSTPDHTPTHTHRDGQHQNIATRRVDALWVYVRPHTHTHTETDSTKT